MMRGFKQRLIKKTTGSSSSSSSKKKDKEKEKEKVPLPHPHQRSPLRLVALPTGLLTVLPAVPDQSLQLRRASNLVVFPRKGSIIVALHQKQKQRRPLLPAAVAIEAQVSVAPVQAPQRKQVQEKDKNSPNNRNSHHNLKSKDLLHPLPL